MQFLECISAWATRATRTRATVNEKYDETQIARAFFSRVMIPHSPLLCVVPFLHVGKKSTLYLELG